MDNSIIEKKLESYGYGNREYIDFVAEGEITVEITLKEYRALVTSDAIKQSKIYDAEKDKITRELENESLKKENAALKAELYEINKKLVGDSELEEERNENE